MFLLIFDSFSFIFFIFILTPWMARVRIETCVYF